MQVFPAKTPDFVKTLFPQLIWHIPTTEKVLYLTFDDGPTPDITEWVLSCLDSYQAKATFFCIGNNIDQNPDIFRRILESGHTVANHTYNHLKGWKTDTNEYIRDVELTQSLLQRHSNTQLFRPPYGKFKISQAKQLLSLGYKIVLWDVLSYDWDRRISPEKCLGNVISKASEGSIIVMHDSVKAFENLSFALPRLLDHFSKDGYSFKALDVLLDDTN